MVPEMEKPRITEIKVRMDCNGCVHKIKKALHGITGIYDLYVDFPQQKITIIGWADPEKIVKAIKKTRKSAVICSHTEQSDQPAQPTVEPSPEGGSGTSEGGAPPPESSNPPTEQPQTEEAQKEPPLPPPPAENPPPPPPPDNPPPESANDTTSQSQKDVEEVQVLYHHPPDYGYRYAYGHYYPQQGNDEQWNGHPNGPGFRGDPPQLPRPVYVTHSYNTYKPTPYVTEYAYPQPLPGYSHYSRPDHYYSPVYYNGSGNGNSNITSMFSEENPNACTIV